MATNQRDGLSHDECEWLRNHGWNLVRRKAARRPYQQSALEDDLDSELPADCSLVVDLEECR